LLKAPAAVNSAKVEVVPKFGAWVYAVRGNKLRSARIKA
jgi:hypothetical protein